MIFLLLHKKIADLARGLANNLDHNAAKPNTTRMGNFRPSIRPDNNATHFNKYQNQN